MNRIILHSDMNSFYASVECLYHPELREKPVAVCGDVEQRHVGVSWNKIFAKLGSDMKKPDAVTIITKDNFKNKVWPLPASDLLYVGPATARKLKNYGIHTIGQLAQMDNKFLKMQFGKWGEYLWAFSNGYDVSPVSPMGYTSPIKSIGNSMTTWRDIESAEEVSQVFLALSESVARRLRENGFRSRTVQISIRDKDLSWCEFQTKLQLPCCTAGELAGASMKLFKKQYNFSKPLRSLGVRACDLTDAASGYQISIFDNAERQIKVEQIDRCLDQLRGRFGKDALTRASLIHADIIGESDPLTHDVHPVGFFH